MASSKVSADPTGATRSLANVTALRRTTFYAQQPTAEDVGEPPLPGSALVHHVVRPALAETERTVSVALGRINIDDMVKRAETLK